MITSENQDYGQLKSSIHMNDFDCNYITENRINHGKAKWSQDETPHLAQIVHEVQI